MRVEKNILSGGKHTCGNSVTEKDFMCLESRKEVASFLRADGRRCY